MKRDQLKELGLTEDQIKSVMALNGDDINKAKSSGEELSKENESLKSQLSERDKDLKKLKSNVKDSDKLTNQLQELQNKYKEDTANLTNKITQVKLNSAIDRTLTNNNVRNPKAIKGLLDMDNVKLDDQGKLIGLDAQIKSIRDSDPYLFNEGTKQKYVPSSGKPSGNNTVQEMVDVFKGEN